MLSSLIGSKLQQARLVGKNFKLLDRRKIGGNVFVFFVNFISLFLIALILLRICFK